MDQGAAGVNAAPPKSFLDAFAPIATQEEAEAGQDNEKRMTPLRAQQHLLAKGVPNTRSVIAGDGLMGGGTLEANRTVALNSDSIASLALADSAVQSVNGKTGGSISLTKSDVGLDNVDNTSDANKPISTATQSALDSKADSSVNISTGTGLTGGGTLTENRTIALNTASIASLGKADTALQAPGGAAGQILAKSSNADNDVDWVTSETATAVSYGPQELTEAQQAQARNNIGAQQAGATLEALAALEGYANTFPYFTGPDTMGIATLTDAARALLTLIGTAAADQMPYFTGSSEAGITPLTAFARSILDDASGAAMWGTMGGDQSLTQNGWCKLPGGLIIQWGGHWSGAGESFSFPMAFPNACYIVLGSKSQTAMAPDNVYDNWQIASYNTAYAFVAGRRITAGSVVKANVTGAWVAIGR